MNNDSAPQFAGEGVPAPDVPVQPPVPSPDSSVPGKGPWIAPWWHLLLVLALLLGNSFIGAIGGKSHIAGPASRVVLYGATFFFELMVVALIWGAIVRRGTTMRELIGGRWDTAESFLMDVAIAIGFWVAALAILTGLRVALGTLDLHNLQHQTAETKKMLAPLIPRTWLEASFFMVLAAGAGLFEEIIFRGYLQRQFTALAKNVWAGIVLSAVIFGLGHGYQGNRMMIVIGVFGALFGILAHLRKSLRPGIMVHAGQDAIAGLLLFFFTKSGIM